MSEKEPHTDRKFKSDVVRKRTLEKAGQHGQDIKAHPRPPLHLPHQGGAAG